MNIQKTKFFVDILMFIDFLIIAISGFVLWLVLPNRSGGLRHVWLNLHNWFSVILIILIIIHLCLNWKWIKAMFRNTFKR